MVDTQKKLYFTMVLLKEINFPVELSYCLHHVYSTNSPRSMG